MKQPQPSLVTLPLSPAADFNDLWIFVSSPSSLRGHCTTADVSKPNPRSQLYSRFFESCQSSYFCSSSKQTQPMPAPNPTSDEVFHVLPYPPSLRVLQRANNSFAPICLQWQTIPTHVSCSGRRTIFIIVLISAKTSVEVEGWAF